MASTTFWPCETRTSTCRTFATISSGLYRFLAITVLLDVKDIPQVGPLQWGWISGEGRTDFSLRSANLPRPVNGWGLFNRLELQIDHFVMAITSVGAKAWHTAQVA